jgi:hypothetical protein
MYKKRTSAPSKPINALQPRDASLLALLAQHPRANQSKRKSVASWLSAEGKKVAEALEPKNAASLQSRETEGSKHIPQNAAEAATGLKNWVLTVYSVKRGSPPKAVPGSTLPSNSSTPKKSKKSSRSKAVSLKSSPRKKKSANKKK